MTVAHLWFDDKIFEADTTEDQTGANYDKTTPGWRAITRCAVLCNKAEFKAEQDQVPVLQRECAGMYREGFEPLVLDSFQSLCNLWMMGI